MGVRDLHATPPSVQRMMSVFQFFGTSSGLTYFVDLLVDLHHHARNQDLVLRKAARRCRLG